MSLCVQCSPPPPPPPQPHPNPSPEDHCSLCFQNTLHSQQGTAPLGSPSGALSLILLMEPLFIKVSIKDIGTPLLSSQSN